MNVGGTVVTSKICEHAGKKYWVLSQNANLCGTPGALLERHGAIYAAFLHEIVVADSAQQTQIMLAPLVYALHLGARRAYSVSVWEDALGATHADAVLVDK